MVGVGAVVDGVQAWSAPNRFGRMSSTVCCMLLTRVVNGGFYRASTENGQGCGPEFALLVGQRHLEACPGSTAPTGAYLWADVRNRHHPCLLSTRRWLVARLTAGQHSMSKVCRTDARMGRNALWRWMLLVYLWPHWLLRSVSARERGRRCTDEPTCHVAGVPTASRFCWWTTTARRAAAIGKAHGIEVRRVGFDDKQPVFASDSARVAGGGSPLHGWDGPDG